MPPRYIPSAAVSRGTGCAKRSRTSPVTSTFAFTRFRPARLFSIGPFPAEWNIRDAYIKAEDGTRVVDFRKSNLHVLNYSAPIHARLPLSALKPHLFTLPDQPDLIPYRTSYYQERWGFCLTHNSLLALPDGMYEVMIDAEQKEGHLTYGEVFLEGETQEEILLSAHICHPSLANDNCAGLALLTQLGKQLSRIKTRFSYRLLFAPGTIGAIAWLAAQ